MRLPSLPTLPQIPAALVRWCLEAATVVVVLAIAAWAAGSCTSRSRPSPAVPLPPVVVSSVATLDSLRVTKAPARAGRDSLRASAEGAQRSILAPVHHAAALEAFDDSTSDALDSLRATLPTPAPTDTVARAWQRWGEGWRLVADSAALAAAERGRGLDSALVAVQRHELAEGAAEQRLDVTEAAGEQLADAVPTIVAGDGCHLGPRWLHVGCPTRRQAVAIGAAAAGGAVVLVKVAPRIVRALVLAGA